MATSVLARRKAGCAGAQRQRGATLIVGLILLALVTLIVMNAFNLSASNLKAVGNMQLREEATSAANNAVEQIVASQANFLLPRTCLNAADTNCLKSQTIPVDIDKDGTNDYTVTVAVPQCVRALKGSQAAPSDVELAPSITSSSNWDTEWDIDATATNDSGVSVRVRQGVRVLLSATEKSISCP